MTAFVEPRAIVVRSRIPLWLIVAASTVYVVVALILTLGAVLSCVDQAHTVASGGAVSVSFDPGIWIREPADRTFAGAPYVLSGSTLHITGVTGTVRGLPVSAVVLPAIADIVADLAGIGIAACVGLICLRVVRGAPFARTTSRALVVLAVIVMVGFEAQSMIAGVGRSVFPSSIMMSQPQTSDGVFFGSSSAVFFSFTPIYIGLALLGLAAVFRVGAQLQSETEGLV